MRAAIVNNENIITNIIIVKSLSDVKGCLYLSELSTLQIGDVYDEALALMIVPTVSLDNVNVTGEHVTLGNGGIWWLPKNSAFTLTANAQLPDAEMMIIVERVINGSTVVDDLRIKATITDGVITVNGLFAMSGNYIVTAERLNQGLEIIDAPFRLAFDKVEFDAHV